MGLSIIIVLIGLFIVINSGNLVGVFKGEKTFNVLGGVATPAATSTPNPTSGPDSLSQLSVFKAAIAKVESGGSYTASNPSGAYGKYQILSSNWPSWAKAAGLPVGATPTPANQETVATFKFTQYFNKYGSWAAVAEAWHVGHVSGPSSSWLDKGYVNKVINQLGLSI